MYLMQTVEFEGSRGEETMANVLAVINKARLCGIFRFKTSSCHDDDRVPLVLF